MPLAGPINAASVQSPYIPLSAPHLTAHMRWTRLGQHFPACAKTRS